MTITRYSNDWNPAMAVLAAYGLIGLVLVLVPTPSDGIFLPIRQLPMIKAMQHRSYDPARMVFFWQWMIIAFPFVFGAFSWVAPIKITAGKVNAWYAIPISVVGFIFFGSSVIGFIWTLFFNDLSTISRSERIIISTGNGPWDLCYAGSILMIMLVAGAWLSYVAIPVSVYKILKLRGEQQQSRRSTNG